MRRVTASSQYYATIHSTHSVWLNGKIPAVPCVAVARSPRAQKIMSVRSVSLKRIYGCVSYAVQLDVGGILVDMQLTISVTQGIRIQCI